MTASLFSTLAIFLSVGSAMFGYFAGRRGQGVICGVQGMVCRVRGVKCLV